MTVHTTGRTGTMAEINVVPLIDVLLVLLVIFMVISPAVSAGLHATVPALSGDAGQAPVVVRILADGSLKLNNEPASWDSLGARLEVIFVHRPAGSAFVQAAEGTRFAEVARVIDLMHASGILEVGLLAPRDLQQPE